jgi:glutamine synthetase adenylyltransferase
MNPLAEAKAWFLMHLVVILGGALALTALYAGWLHFVTVPSAELKAKVAEANVETWKANTTACTVANSALASAIDRSNAVVAQLAKDTKLTKEQVSALLTELHKTWASVKETLAGYQPDKTKSDCENAMTQLKEFRRERGY